jgi:hypothetical protein
VAMSLLNTAPPVPGKPQWLLRKNNGKLQIPWGPTPCSGGHRTQTGSSEVIGVCEASGPLARLPWVSSARMEDLQLGLDLEARAGSAATLPCLCSPRPLVPSLFHPKSVSWTSKACLL